MLYADAIMVLRCRGHIPAADMPAAALSAQSIQDLSLHSQPWPVHADAMPVLRCRAGIESLQMQPCHLCLGHCNEWDLAHIRSLCLCMQAPFCSSLHVLRG